ncbi:hypothetical protein AMTR_s00005p00227280 [Amborella trichopoda]|uniref:Partner of Nob1 n=1 Tax=Amborella trichopoda TaxID=13333 RepID=W1PGK0_AMBTC|nr:hypothetical protein AMTR_s00005p00227280 [Amborella trichopoda]
MQGSEAPESMAVNQAQAQTRPKFESLKAHEMSDGRVQCRKVSVPAHRFTPLKKAWMEIYTPVYEQMKIDIRMNLKVQIVLERFIGCGTWYHELVIVVGFWLVKW